MVLGLEGKVAIVTGSTRGIGTAVAASSLDEGASLGIISRQNEDVEAVIEEFKEWFDDKVLGIPADLTKDEKVDHMANSGAEKLKLNKSDSAEDLMLVIIYKPVDFFIDDKFDL